MGGTGGEGTNPEQLFACGYSSCFLNAVKFTAQRDKVDFDEKNSSCEVTVSIGPTEVGFGLSVQIKMYLLDLEQSTAESLVSKAHETCPYSNAIQGNVEVKIEVITT